MNNESRHAWSDLSRYPGDTTAKNIIRERKRKANRHRRIRDNSRRNSHRQGITHR